MFTRKWKVSSIANYCLHAIKGFQVLLIIVYTQLKSFMYG